jgi:hypothetical protein
MFRQGAGRPLSWAAIDTTNPNLPSLFAAFECWNLQPIKKATPIDKGGDETGSNAGELEK